MKTSLRSFLMTLFSLMLCFNGFTQISSQEVIIPFKRNTLKFDDKFKNRMVELKKIWIKDSAQQIRIELYKKGVNCLYLGFDQAYLITDFLVDSTKSAGTVNVQRPQIVVKYLEKFGRDTVSVIFDAKD